MSALLVQVGSEVLPLEKCSWVFRGSCGCAYGVAIAQTAARCSATEDQAWADFEPNRIQRDRDRALGDTATLLPTSQAVDALRDDCSHEPRYGHPVTPVPDGYLWAATDGLNARARVKHLVAEPSERPERGWLYPWDAGRVKALCRRSESRQWSDRKWLIEDLPECTACAKAAAR